MEDRENHWRKKEIALKENVILKNDWGNSPKKERNEIIWLRFCLSL